MKTSQKWVAFGMMALLCNVAVWRLTADNQPLPTLLDVYPPDIKLQSSRASQALVVCVTDPDGITHDVSNSAKISTDPKLAKIDGEIQKFRTEVEAESKNDEARIKASLTEESARIVEAAEQEIGQAAAQARRGLRNFAADLAIDQAARQLNLTPEVDRALIAEFVTSAGNGNSSKGGIN